MVCSIMKQPDNSSLTSINSKNFLPAQAMNLDGMNLDAQGSCKRASKPSYIIWGNFLIKELLRHI